MKVQLDPGALLPARATAGSAGLDLAVNEDALIKPAKYGVRLVSTGVHVAIPAGYVGLVFARSSLCKIGLALANGVGVIDSDYRGPIKLALIPIDGKAHRMQRGARVAQLILVPFVNPVMDLRGKLAGTGRGNGSFGSTGA